VLNTGSIAIFFAAGAVAGLYFRVFVLVVPIAAALAFAAMSVLAGYSFAFAGIVLLSAAISCQVGYLAGGLIQTRILQASAGTIPHNHRRTGLPAFRPRQSLRYPQEAPRQPRLPRHRRHPAG
jgi:hypothetical protein